MVLESAADLQGYFDTDAHGVSATITINGSSSSVNVILNKEYFGIDPGTAIEIEGTQPVATLASSDCTNVDNQDTIRIDSITYNIVSVQKDGVGITTLVLEEQ
tara:strand:+ start:1561 stop:1869 length:309 start_codon:yes stop_codon:yes gene_type:complete